LTVRATLAVAVPADRARQEALAGGYRRLANPAEATSDLTAARAAMQSEVIIRGWLAAALLEPMRLDELAEAQARLAELTDPDVAADDWL
jgi:hypothetical protein